MYWFGFALSPRGVPSASPVDSAVAVIAVIDRLVLKDASNSILNSERSLLMSREQNGGVGSISSSAGSGIPSPVGYGKREMFIRHAYPTWTW